MNALKLFSEDENYTKNGVENIGKALKKIREVHNLNNKQLLHVFDLNIYKSEQTISRIINLDGKRPPSAEQFIELRRVFGADLNEIADCGKHTFEIEKLSDVQLLEALHQISEELLRRKWQK